MNNKSQNILEEGIFQDVVDFLKEKGKQTVASTRTFLNDFKQEFSESKEGVVILTKMVKGEKLSPEESSFLKTQLIDIGKGLPLLAILAAPGGSIVAAVLVRLADKLGVNLMPTAFQKETTVTLTEGQLRALIKDISESEHSKAMLKKMIREELESSHKWLPGDVSTLNLDQEGIEKDQRNKIVKYLKSLGIMK